MVFCPYCQSSNDSPQCVDESKIKANGSGKRVSTFKCHYCNITFQKIERIQIKLAEA